MRLHKVILMQAGSIRSRLPLAAAFILSLAASAASAATWGVLERDGAGRHTPPYLSSLLNGEQPVGAVRSATFVLDADTVSFEMCGWDGPPEKRGLKDWFALCDADTGLALRRTGPPQTDAMTPVQWDVVELVGKRVYFRAVDGMSGNGFSWIGLQNVRVGARALLGPMTAGKWPEGWTEETRPANASVDEWLAVKSASSKYALEVDSSTSTWGVITFNGVRATCAPYLCSLRGGESGVGAVRSPAFTLDQPRYSFLAMGADSPTGDAGLNEFQLVDADTLEILRRAEPPVGNTLVPVSWDTKDLVGRHIFFRAVDGNDAPAWAWIGCDKVPLGAGRIADFTKPGALDGWREEGQPDGSLTGGVPVAKTLDEMIAAEWQTEDVRCGVRWSLWEHNKAAAPYIMRRLARIMDDDFSRADYLIRDFARAGASASVLDSYRPKLAALKTRMAALQTPSPDASAWQNLRHDQRAVLRELAFRNPLLDFDRIVFVKRFTQQSYCDINVNHHAWGSRPGGGVCILTLDKSGANPQVTELLKGRLGLGNVHGYDLDWNAGRILFAYARSASATPPDGWLSRQATFDIHRTVDLLHLYEMKADGSDLRQLTRGQWSDLNPCYLPSGDIAFESERCALEIECNECDKDEPTTNLFTMRDDGSDIRRLTVTKDGDWYPRVLNDGSIVYSHWEYQERSLMFIHPLWSVLPDGTGANNYAKQHLDYPLTLTVPRPIPGSDKVIAIAGGHHTLASGPVVLVDRTKGPNDAGCLTRLTGPDVWPEMGGAAPPPDVPGWHIAPGQGWYMDPYPLSETTFLASYCDGPMQDEAGYGLYLMDAYGGKELIYRDPTISSVMPIPLKARPKPPVIAGMRENSTDQATCIVANVADAVPGLKAGAVKALRIAEPVPWSYSNETGGVRYEPDAKATGVNWTPIRILGTVPVEADGSAYFHVPPGRAVYFQALDDQGMELRRMRSYIAFQPGEVRSCTGCHETRTEVQAVRRNRLLALTREPSKPAPPPWGEAPLSFLRDIQPILDRNCLRCHTGLKPAGKVDLSAGLTLEHNRAYDTLMDPALGLLAVSSKGLDAGVTDVLAVGSHKSRLFDLLRSTHKDRCDLTPDDWMRLYTWVDANAVYHDDFIRKRPESALPAPFVEDTALWAKLTDIGSRRCASCHAGQSLFRPEWVDLKDPQRSLFVAAPLAGATTPTGKHCAPAVFKDKTDPDCAAILAALDEAVRKVRERPRRDLRYLVAAK
jgi:hypothetical protein